MRLKTCGALASVAVYGVFPYLLGCNSPVAGEDCPSFKEATDACKDEGKCWEYRRGGDEALNLELGVDTVKGSGQGAASCDVVCSNCSDMVAPVEVPLPETNLEKDVLSLARALCERWYACDAFSPRRLAGEIAHCVAAMNAEYLLLMQLPRSGINAESIAQCAESHADSCLEPFMCAFAGTGENGALCMSWTQCQSSYCTGTAWQCGECAPWPSLGAACSNDEQCPNHDDFCHNGVCTRQQQAGEPCGDTLTCAGSMDCIDGICMQATQSLGEACGIEVNMPYCELGSVTLGCDVEEHVCKLAAIGASGDACPVFGWCAGAGACFDGTCRLGPGPGDLCNETDFLPCRWPYRCAAQRCQDVPAEDTCPKP